MFKRLSKKAQTTAEYAILIALVVGAVIAMQIYVRRSLQSKIRDAADFTVNVSAANASFNFTSRGQYEPYYYNSTSSTTQRQTLTENMETSGRLTRGTNLTANVTRNQTTGWYN
jgi:uncharacterized protein (UPF0333 family)